MKKLALLLLLGTAFGQQQQHQQLTGTIPASGGSTVNLQDALGTTSHSFAAWQTNGTVTSPSLTVYGCVRNPVPGQAGACTSMGTIAALGTPSTYTGAYDYFYVTGTWTGSGQVYITESDTIARVSGGNSGVASINGTAGAFTFTGSGVTCSGTTCTFTGGTSGVTSYNTRTGAVTPASGDYTVGQVTGAAPSSNPSFTGTVTIPNGGLVGLLSCANQPADTLGDLTSASGTCQDTVVGIGGQNLAALGAGIYKFNASGVPALAASGTDYDAPGAATAVKNYITSINGLLQSNGTSTFAAQGGSAYQVPALPAVYGVSCFGDSTVFGLYSATSFGIVCNALNQDIPGPEANYGNSGTYSEAIAASAWSKWAKTTTLNQMPYVDYEGTINDANQTNGGSGGGGNTTGALQNASWAIESGVVHLTLLPQAAEKMASTATATGTWTTFTSSYLAPNAVITGTLMSSTASGSTHVYALPSGANIAYTWGLQDSNPATFTLLLNGTALTSNCGASTTFASTGCSSALIVVNGGYSFATQVFSGGNTTSTNGSCGSPNCLTVTVTSSSGTVIDVAAATVPSPLTVAPIIGIQGLIYQQANQTSAATAAYNTAIQNVYTDLHSKGFTNTIFVDPRNGISAGPYNLAVAGMSSVTDYLATPPYSGGSGALHPNDQFEQRLAKLHEATAAAAGLAIATPNSGLTTYLSRNFIPGNLTNDFTNDILVNNGGGINGTYRSPGICLNGNGTNCNARVVLENDVLLGASAVKYGSSYTQSICSLYTSASAASLDACSIRFSAFSRTGMEATAPIRAGVGGGWDTNAITSNNNLAITWESQQRVTAAASTCTALECYLASTVTSVALPACGTYSTNYNGNWWQDYINDSTGAISVVFTPVATNPTDTINGATTATYTMQPNAHVHLQCSRATGTGATITAVVEATPGGVVNTSQVIGTGTPTYAPGTQAGTGATVAATSGSSNTDVSGRITLTTGTGTTASGTLATISFGGTHATPFQVCVLQAIGANANGQVAMVAPTFPTTTSWTIAVAGSAIPASTTYTYGYICQ